jgi:hypothetical protein
VIQGEGYPTLVEQVTDPTVVFVASAEGWKITEPVIAPNTWKKANQLNLSIALTYSKENMSKINETWNPGIFIQIRRDK